MAENRQTTSSIRRHPSTAVTAAVLDPRSGDGWWVLHDLAVPGADHVVVTPGAVWVVASSPGEPAPAEVEALSVGAAQVERELATSAVGLMAPVLPVIAVTSAAAPGAHAAGPVAVVAVASLTRLLAGVPAEFTPSEVAHVAELVDASFANRRGADSSLVRPAPEPPASRELPVMHPSGRVLYGDAGPGPEPVDLVFDVRPQRVRLRHRAAFVATAAGATGLIVTSLVQLLGR